MLFTFIYNSLGAKGRVEEQRTAKNCLKNSKRRDPGSGQTLKTVSNEKQKVQPGKGLGDTGG